MDHVVPGVEKAVHTAHTNTCVHTAHTRMARPMAIGGEFCYTTTVAMSSMASEMAMASVIMVAVCTITVTMATITITNVTI